MTYVTDAAIDFTAVARELLSTQPQAKTVLSAASRSDGSELVPAEVTARMRREGNGFQRPLFVGATVDQEGLTNNYAIEPETYLALYPSPEEQRAYFYQGAIALLFVTLTILTAFAVS